VFVGEDRLIRRWSEDDGKTVRQADRTLQGKHTIRVEYFEQTGAARVRVWWEKL
jgi:hypothetical protein